MSASRSILIVEDEPLIAMMLEDFLDSLGHKVRGTCDSVQGALDEIEKGGFDLAILDMQMPEMDGLELARAIRKRSASGTSPSLSQQAATSTLRRPNSTTRL